MRTVRGWAQTAGRVVVRVTLGLSVLATGVLGLTPTGRYLARAGWEEGRILLARRPIKTLVADPGVPAPTRAKLRLVLEARAFA